MRILALETNPERVKQDFCGSDETLILTTRYHWMSFMFAIVREIFLTIVFFTVGTIAWEYGLPLSFILPALIALWFVFIFFRLTKALIDWRFDLILVTSDKVILVNQSSLFKREIHPIHLENIGSVTARTQFWNVFPFGVIQINLKEGLGDKVLTLRYVPHAQHIAGRISDVVTRFQRGQKAGQLA